MAVAETAATTAKPAAATGGMLSAARVVFAGNLVARAFGFLFPVVLAHSISKSEFALVYFFIGTGFFVGELVLAGFPGAMTRFLAAHPDDDTWITTSVLCGIPLLVVSVIVGEVVAALTHAPWGLMTAVVVGLTIDAYYFGFLRGIGRFPLLALYRVVANGAQIVLLVVALQLGGGTPLVAVMIYSFVYLVPIAAIELRTGLLRRHLRGPWRATADHRRRLLKFAIPALISGTAYAGITQLEVFYVKVLAPHALADYAAASSLAQPMLLVPFAVGIVLMPNVAAASPAEQRRMLSRGLIVTAAASLAAVAGYVLLGGWVIDTILPSTYQGAHDPLPLLATALGLIGTYTTLSQWWLGRGRAIVPATTMTIATLVTAGAQLYLTPKHGATGAACALIAGGVVALVSLAIVTARAMRAERL
jgi:O-antigen/teichoic acid export membrane protein